MEGKLFCFCPFFLVALGKKTLVRPKQFCTVGFKTEEVIYFFFLFLVLQEDCKWFGGLMSTLVFFLISYLKNDDC